MLTDLDKELIEEEAHRFDTKNWKRWLDPLYTCNYIQGYEDLISKYDIHELTQHWYDSSPRFDNISCDLCNKEIKCVDCSAWQKWQGSKKQLSFNTWIDVWGPGIWGETQAEVNDYWYGVFKDEILMDKEFHERTYYYQPPDEKYLQIFYYNRDRERFDYWYVLEKKCGRRT